MRNETWPPLPFAEWKEAAATLHMWTQIVGKVRLALTPWTNHSWHVTLYVTTSGLTTSPIAHGSRCFEIGFDFVAHALVIRTSDGAERRLGLRAMSVAEFYEWVIRALREMELPVEISTTPNEVQNAIPFPEDRTNAAYYPEYANHFWRVLLQSDRIFKIFRSRFIGKCSPVHFFWGSFDLAVTRFSGRPAPSHPGGVPNMPLRVAEEAYSHEVSSAGFWPGSDAMPQPIFYSYAYPTPAGFAEAKLAPAAGQWNAALGEFVLAYDEVRTAREPDDVLLAFLQNTYEAAANLAKWDREALEHRGRWPNE